jgi:hypothetical protein
MQFKIWISQESKCRHNHTLSNFKKKEIYVIKIIRTSKLVFWIAWLNHRHLIKNRLINVAFPMSLLVDATKILEALAGTSIDQACLPCQPACLVLCPLLSLLLKWIICELICLEVIYFSYISMVLTSKFQSRMSCVCFERMYRCTP